MEDSNGGLEVLEKQAGGFGFTTIWLSGTSFY